MVLSGYTASISSYVKLQLPPSRFGFFFFQEITRLEKKSQGLQGHLALLLERDLVVVGVEKILLAFR